MFRLSQHTLESIDLQINSSLFHSLVEEITLFRKNNAYNKTAYRRLCEKLEKTVYAKTGIKADFVIHSSFELNACAEYPLLDKNHSLLIEGIQKMIRSTAMIGSIKEKKEVFDGLVDLRRSRVGGVFSKLPATLTINSSLLKKNPFTVEETAGVVLHEIGHVFSYFEHLGKMVSTNFIFDHVSRELVNTREPVVGYQLIRETCDTLDIVIEDPKALVLSQKPAVVYTVFLQAALKKKIYELNSSYYDQSSSEQLADQFASRHGAGRYLAEGLEKLYSYGGHRTFYPPALHLFTETLTTLTLVVNPVSIVFFVLIVVLEAKNFRIYDDPLARIERIRRDLIDQLKNRRLDRETLSSTHQHIERLNEMVEHMHRNRPFYEFLADSLFRRKQVKQMEFQQQLEQLVNNDLFYHAARFKTAS